MNELLNKKINELVSTLKGSNINENVALARIKELFPSEEFKHEFIENSTDFYIEDNQGKTIIELFKNGEDYFRNIETETCKELGERSKTIISSGGGVVKKRINIEYLKKNSIVVFIDRPVENILGDIEVEKRPLLANGKEVLYKLYDERYDLYKEYCDYRVENTGSLEEVVNKIAKVVNR